MGCAPANNQGIVHPAFVHPITPITRKDTVHENNTNGLDLTFRTFSSVSKGHNLISADILRNMYTDCQGNIDKFIKSLEQDISDKYLNLTKEALENMNSGKFTQNQSKVFISQQILSANLIILKTISEGMGTKLEESTFKKLNKMQKNLIGYVKVKYPRNQQNFVPGDLMQVFKSFDMVEHPDNDIIRNSKFYFGDSETGNLVRKIKQFLNCIITQSDTAFPVFQKLLQQRVFAIETETGLKTVSHKICRKLPENTQRYQKSESNILQIKNPEIFRVIIKWVSDMEQYILFPAEQIHEKKYFKVVREEEGLVQYNDVSTVEFCEVTSELLTKLSQQKEKYQMDIQNLRKDMDIFNNNLLEVLHKCERVQRFVPQRQAQVIKYAMFNTKLLSWIISQKLLLVMKKLISIGKSFEETQHLLKVDLIKFNVTDLLRARMVGTKKQVIGVYNNLLKLENQGQIRIIKVKNRLSTPMNDSMVIFTIKSSFLICQLQLILTEGQKKENQKLKNVQVINHFFYQLERSPYGVLSELAVVLGYKDSKINFENHIHFSNTDYSINECLLKHPSKIIDIHYQSKPFICTRCTYFFEPLQNHFIMKNCRQCNTYICNKCICKNDPKQFMKYSFQNLSSSMEIQIAFIKSMTLRDRIQIQLANVMSLFDKNSIVPLTTISQGKKKLTILQLVKYFRKYHEQHLKNYFTIVQFRLGKIKPYSVKFDEQNQLEVLLNQRGLFQNGRDTYIEDYDFLVLYNIIPQPKQTIPPMIINIFNKKYQRKEKDIFYGCPIVESKPQIFFLVDFCVSVNDQEIIEGVKVYQQQLLRKKVFKYQTIDEERSKLPNVKTSRSIYDLSNTGITTELLIHFKDINWKNQVKELNLAQNKIVKIDYILQNLLNIEKLYLSQNFINEVNFVKLLNNLTIANFSENRITKVQNLSNIPQILRLNFSINKIGQFQKGKMHKLRELSLGVNCIQDCSGLINSQMPELRNLFIKQCIAQYQLIQSVQFKLPKLKIFQSIQNYFASFIEIVSPSLETLILSSSYITQLAISSNKLKKIDISNNQTLANISFLYKCELDNLTQLYLQLNAITQIPIIKAEKLKILNFSDNQISDLKFLQLSKMPKLSELTMGSNPIQFLPKLQFPELVLLSVNYCSQLQTVKKLQQSILPKLKKLYLQGLSNVSEFPFLNMPQLEQVSFKASLFSVNLQNLSNSIIPLLKNLQLQQCPIEQFPLLKLPFLETIDINQTSIKNFMNMKNSVLPSLKILKAQYINSEKDSNIIPKLNFPKLQQINLRQSQITTISELVESNLSSLLSLTLSFNSILIFPILKIQSLKFLQIDNCHLKQVNNLAQSFLPNLENISIDRNQIVQLPSLNFPKLKYLNLSQNILSKIQNFSNSKLQSLETLNFSNTQISILPILNLKSLKTLTLYPSRISNILNFQKSNLPSLTQIILIQVGQPIQQLPLLNLPSLVKIEITYCNLMIIDKISQSNLPILQTINFNDNQIVNIPKLNLMALTVFKFSRNKVIDISSMQFWNTPKLNRLQFLQNAITKVPKMNFPMLKSIFGNKNPIKEVSQFKKSIFPCLQILNLEECQILQFIYFPNGIEQLALSRNKIVDISDINKYAFSKIFISYNQIVEVPVLNQPKLSILIIEANKIVDVKYLFQQQFPCIVELSLRENPIKIMPKIKAPLLSRLYLNDNQLNNVEQFCQSSLPSLSMLSFESGTVKNIPKLYFPGLREVYLSKNPIESLDFLKDYEYPVLWQFVADKCSITKVPSLLMPALTRLYLGNNMIDNIDFLATSKCPNLQLLQMINNKITKLIKFPFPVLTQIYLTLNPIEDIGDFLNSQIPDYSSISFSLNILDDTKRTEKILKIQQRFYSCSPTQY